MILNKPPTRLSAAVFLILGGLFMSAGCADKADRPAVYSRYETQSRPRSLTTVMSDTLLANQVRSKLRADDLVDAGDIDVSVSRAVVRLTGTVETAAVSRMAADLARGVEGVVSVENRIVIRH